MSKADLPESADSGAFSIYDAATDELIYKKLFNYMPAGPVDLTWNGQNQDGEDMPAGQYRFEFVANKDGNPHNTAFVKQAKNSSGELG